ncbi:MAG TPA: hypothetical protein VG317_10025 [Pseudonocardiaceae bacterium]|nr:hypothetical protein [Pseudonocardiaceae bacterium]
MDVQIRTEENYRSLYRNHIQPQWGAAGLGDITGIAVATWAKGLRQGGYAPDTVTGITKLLSTMLADAADEHLIPGNPIRNRHRGRRNISRRTEVVWPTPEEALAVAAQAATLSNTSDGLLLLTAAWTGARWGELTGVQRPNLHLDDGLFIVDPRIGALHESSRAGVWLGPPKTATSARTVGLPPFLADLLRVHLAGHDNPIVFPTVMAFLDTIGDTNHVSGPQRRAA